MKARLPNFFSYKSAKDLIRIGKKNDGGYLVSKSDVEKSDILISLGISDDWSFEEDFQKIKEVKIFAYDGSVSKKIFLKKIFYFILRLKFKRAMSAVKTFYSFYSFFKKKNNNFTKNFVGFDGVNKNRGHISLENVLNKNQEKNLFLKIDIEGSEYRILSTLLSMQKNISGLVIEFHDSDLHLEIIDNFIKNLNLKLVHIHANNFCGITTDKNIPIVLELTFSRYSELLDQTVLPHDLDMPNDKGSSEIELTLDN